jgi:hypothetical protein
MIIPPHFPSLQSRREDNRTVGSCSPIIAIALLIGNFSNILALRVSLSDLCRCVPSFHIPRNRKDVCTRDEKPVEILRTLNRQRKVKTKRMRDRQCAASWNSSGFQSGLEAPWERISFLCDSGRLKGETEMFEREGKTKNAKFRGLKACAAEVQATQVLPGLAVPFSCLLKTDFCPTDKRRFHLCFIKVQAVKGRCSSTHSLP